jgi:hypothetical protein
VQSPSETALNVSGMISAFFLGGGSLLWGTFSNENGANPLGVTMTMKLQFSAWVTPRLDDSLTRFFQRFLGRKTSEDLSNLPASPIESNGTIASTNTWEDALQVSLGWINKRREAEPEPALSRAKFSPGPSVGYQHSHCKA